MSHIQVCHIGLLLLFKKSLFTIIIFIFFWHFYAYYDYKHMMGILREKPLQSQPEITSSCSLAYSTYFTCALFQKFKTKMLIWAQYSRILKLKCSYGRIQYKLIWTSINDLCTKSFLFNVESLSDKTAPLQLKIN